MTRLLTDADVHAFPILAALDALREALRAHARGTLSAPARLHAANLAFTVGALSGGGRQGVLGFRAYHTLDAPHDDQLVAVWDAATGKLEGVVVGSALGPLRTACLGAVAADLLARPDARTLGLIGSGVQARAHALAVAQVRSLTRVRVYSRSAQRREALAHDLRARGLPAEAVGSAQEAAGGSDLLTLATNSPVPVIESGWLEPGTHVTTLGPKERERHEFPADLANRAGLIVTDSPAQLGAYPGGHLLAGAPVKALSTVLEAGYLRPSPDDITLFLSVGLAGTEVALAHALLNRT
ncbi:ornithine cyclodeaminase family protein [Deinococcus budaensis]|uniref:Ornithine cyclodeaminase n=1 Tax=Deinococcus budaensis TaxID=1665626 RepID=A0A7W8GDW9_9DEIO|nr:ornithine cyclodeaminase family protein [Deinococcus budaensis]MBB5233790.1 ornithine cyclodeaminase [Deinococcus budaensis]